MVAKVNRLGSAAASVHYFEREGGYYARNDPEHRRASRWHGSGAAALGLKGRVNPWPFRAVLEGKVPKTDIRLGRRTREGETEHEPGHDITFSAPKSVSLEGLLWGREEVVRAHDEAVKATLDFIEARLLETRVWDREFRRMRRAPSPSMVAATFRHVASRDLDPQLHTHAVVANMTQDAEGRWRSLDTGRLKGAEKLIGAHYRNGLARRLMERGYTLSPSMAGGVPSFEIAGYGRAELSAFSNRRLAILRYVKERGWNYNAARAQQAALATRARKNEPGRAALEELWRGRAKELGFRRPRKRRTRPPPALSMLEIACRAAEHLEERRSVFPANDLVMRCLAHSPGRYTVRDVDEAVAQLVRDGHLMETVRRGVSGRAFVTDRTVRTERGMLALLGEGAGAGRPLTEAEPVEARLAASVLTDGQKEAVRTILLHDDLVVGVQGYAGTGKTAMLREAAALAGDRRVFGLAPSAAAAGVLGREAGIPVRTLQWFLARYRDVGDNLLDDRALAGLRKRFEGSILVADEMSMASTAQTFELMKIAAKLGVGRLALVGDRKQLRAVEAGQPFRQLQEAGMATALMDDIRRQRDPVLKAAVVHTAAGEPRRALGLLGENVVELPADELAETAAQLWLELSPEERRETLLLAPTHELRRGIVDAVREGLEVEGVLHGRVLEIGTLAKLRMTRAETGDIRNWSEGDVAVFHRDIYPYRIRAGDACTVTGFEGDRVLLEHPDGGARRIRPAGEIRYRLDLYETQTISIRAGDRIRWTRNDRARSLDNGATAEILSIGPRNLRLLTEDGRELEWRHDDPQLRYILHAWASTVHAAQGMTRDRVIAVADAGHGHLGGLQSFYVQISRARDDAVVLTDDRESLAAALEADDGERLTALEALGEDIALPEEETAGRAPMRVPAKRPLAPVLKPEAQEQTARAEMPEPDAVTRAQDAEERFEAWRASKARHDGEAARAGVSPALHAGHDGLLADLRTLAQVEDAAPETRAAVEAAQADMDAGRVSACLQELRRRLEARSELLPGAERSRTVDRPGYADWRRELESAATAARAVLADDGPPAVPGDDGREELKAMLVRAHLRLASDDALFRSRTADARVRDWHGRWTKAMERAREPGGAEEPDRLAALARPIMDDPDLGELDRRHVEIRLADWKARGEAETAGAAWLAAWNGDGEEERAERSEDTLGKGRSLAADPAMPPALRQHLLDALRAHDGVEAERAEREARRNRAREAATAARREADDIAFRLRTGNWTREADEMNGLLARGERLATSRDLSGTERRRLEEALGRERERRAAALLQAVRTLDPADPWPHALLSRAEAVARDPKLDAGSRRNLDTAVAFARRRTAAHGDFETWRLDWDAFRAPVEAKGLVAFADRGCRPHVERAREIVLDPDLPRDAKDRLTTFLHDHDIAWPLAVRRYGELLAQWKELREEAKTRIGRFDIVAGMNVIDDMRDLAASPHLTEAQKKTFLDIAAERDAHVERLRRHRQQERTLSRDIDQGWSM